MATRAAKPDLAYLFAPTAPHLHAHSTPKDGTSIQTVQHPLMTLTQRIDVTLRHFFSKPTTQRSTVMTGMALLRLNHIILTDNLRSREARLLKRFLRTYLLVEKPTAVLLAIEYIHRGLRGDALVFAPDEEEGRGKLYVIECKTTTQPQRKAAGVADQARRMADQFTAIGLIENVCVQPMSVVGWQGQYRVRYHMKNGAARNRTWAPIVTA